MAVTHLRTCLSTLLYRLINLADTATVISTALSVSNTITVVLSGVEFGDVIEQNKRKILGGNACGRLQAKLSWCCCLDSMESKNTMPVLFITCNLFPDFSILYNEQTSEIFKTTNNNIRHQPYIIICRFF